MSKEKLARLASKPEDYKRLGLKKDKIEKWEDFCLRFLAKQVFINKKKAKNWLKMNGGILMQNLKMDGLL